MATNSGVIMSAMAGSQYNTPEWQGYDNLCVDALKTVRTLYPCYMDDNGHTSYTVCSTKALNRGEAVAWLARKAPTSAYLGGPCMSVETTKPTNTFLARVFGLPSNIQYQE